MSCAFRIHGDFVWPPFPESMSDVRQKGVVEIHISEMPEGAADAEPCKAWLHWRPDGCEPGPPTPPDAGDTVYAHPDPATLFLENKPVSLWIFAPHGAAAVGKKLRFRGATQLEQTALSEDDEPLRWPLVDLCHYKDGDAGVYSELIIGQSGNDSFRLNLLLPMPFGQTTQEGTNDPAVLPFSVLYSPSVAKQQIVQTFHTLVCGAAAPGNGSFQLSKHRYPARCRLGAFYFKAGGDNDDGKAVVYRGAQMPRPDRHGKWNPTDIDDRELKFYWPHLVSTRVREVLQRIGFNIEPIALPYLVKTLDDVSVRFEGSHVVPRIIYRIVLTVPPDAATKGPIRWTANGFSLQLEACLGGGWLDTGAKSLTLEVTTEYRGIGDMLLPFIAVDLFWTQTVSFGADETPAKAGLYTSGLLPAGASAFSTLRRSLYQLEGGTPQSFLPDWSVKSAKNVPFQLSSPFYPVQWSPQTPLWVRGERSGEVLRLSLVPSYAGIEVTATLPGFIKDQPDAMAWLLKSDDLWLTRDEKSDWSSDEAFASFTISLEATAAAVPDTGKQALHGRLSSLQLTVVKEGLLPPSPGRAEAEPMRLRLGARRDARAASPLSGLGHAKQPLSSLDLHLVLGLTKVEPVTLDQARGDRTGRALPLLMAMDDKAEQAGAIYYLSVHETASVFNDRLLTAQLFENDQGGTGSPDSYVVLGQEPFSLMRFSMTRLGDRGEAGNQLIASYSSDERIWNLKHVADTYHYVLPPQVVGESMDKPRRLELHDLPEAVPLDGVIRPFADDEPEPSAARGHLQRRAVEFKLTPPAEIWIKPSDVERGYFLPEWSIYDIFRQRGALGLGAALRGLRAEFLYGLTVGVETALEDGAARNARVTEIDALLGRTLSPSTEELTLGKRWVALSRAIARRPERLEVWAHDPDQPMDFAPARFAKGVSFALRGTALHRAPTKEFDDGQVLTAAPGPGAAGSTTSPRFHPQGLSGGALWPIEQRNLFERLLVRPQSSGGEIGGIALSPLGGDAVQKALFLDGQVSIISRTEGGFVSRVQVEVIGRIAALWHRAKHVVVYERTVSPSPQFAPTRAEDPQRTRTRRPALRKVREYIELLEPERRYPDFAEATQRHAGFLEKVRFNSGIINVDSAWARDVGTTGWEIPLWNRKSAAERPQVYTMPDISFVTTAEGDGDAPNVAQGCLDPDHLCFFADFTTGMTDTDTWSSRAGIDTVAFNAVAYARSLEASGRKADGPSNNAGRFLPGLRRFTWRLAPAGQKTMMNAGRSAKPVYVGLESVTFMRNTPIGALPATHQAALEARTKLAALPISGLPGPGYWDAVGDGGPQGAADFSRTISAFATLLEQNPPSIDAVKALKQTVDDLWSNAAGNGLKKAIAAQKPKPDDLTGLIENVAKAQSAAPPRPHPSVCDTLDTDLRSMIANKQLLILENIKTVEGDTAAFLAALKADLRKTVDTLVPEAFPYAIGKQEIAKALLLEMKAALKPVFREASDDLSGLGQALERVRAVLADAQSDMQMVLQRARARVSAVSNAWDRSKPWSPSRLKTFENDLSQAVASVAGDVFSAVEEARLRIGIEAGDLQAVFAAHLGQALARFAAEKTEALKGLSPQRLFITQQCAALRAEMTRLENPDLAALQTSLDLAYADLSTAGLDPDIEARTKALLDAGQDVLAQLKALTGEVAAELDALESASGAATEETIRLVAALATKVTDSVKAGAAAISHALRQVPELGDQAARIVTGFLGEAQTDIDTSIKVLSEWMQALAQTLDAVVEPMVQAILADIDETVGHLTQDLGTLLAPLLPLVDESTQSLAGAAFDVSALCDTVVGDAVLAPVCDRVLKDLPDTLILVQAGAIEEGFVALSRILDQSTVSLQDMSKAVREQLSALSHLQIDGLDQAKSACNSVVGSAEALRDYLEHLKQDPDFKRIDAAKTAFDNAVAGYADTVEQAQALLAAVGAFDRGVRAIHNDLVVVQDRARVYVDRVLEDIGSVGSGPAEAVPGRVLKLYSAVTSSPELGALKCDVDRIRATYDDLNDIIETTRTNALFDRMGDELRALGLTFPFDRVCDRLMAVDLHTLDLCKVFVCLGGLKFDKMLKACKISQGAVDAVRVTHDFDKAQALAWVNIDIDIPLDGRQSLFSLEVFSANFVSTRLKARMRLEASKDSESLTQTGYGRIETDLEMAVAGEAMVTFERLAIHFTRETGLNVEFDPKNIRLNPCLQFVQNYLGNLFPDTLGALQVVKRDGIPVGIEHEFAMPPISLNVGTSGVQNIQIANHFQLVAFPDFKLSNRFNLSRPEAPFIFSIFVIGGTGYVQIDVDYLPCEQALAVTVEAAVGGSASLAFSFGPFVGQVYVTLSIALSYRKVTNGTGSGLSVMAILLIVGNVSVCGIVNVNITLMLRMTYRESGAIEAQGTLSVTIRISTFFKITARAAITYTMRDGQASTQTSASLEHQVTDERFLKAKNTAEKIRQARG